VVFGKALYLRIKSPLSHNFTYIYVCFLSTSVGSDAVSHLVVGTSRNVTGSFRDSVNSSGRTMVLGSTQPPTEMSTWNFLGELEVED